VERGTGAPACAEEAASPEIWLVPLPGELLPAEMLDLFGDSGAGTSEAGPDTQAAAYDAGSR
jgi:hypothetical protein